MLTKTLLLMLAVFADAAFADEETRPANFSHPEHKHRFTSHFAWPAEATRKTELMLNCFSVVNGNGKMQNTGCFTNSNFEQAFAVAVSRAAKSARMNPAIVNGKVSEVYVQFRVKLQSDALKKIPIPKQEEGEEELSKKEKRKAKKKAEAQAIVNANRRISLRLNPGYEENVEAYGDGHVAGQRVIGKNEPWSDVCPKRAKFAVWARAFLGEDGKATSPTIEHANGILPTAACQDAIKQTIVSSRYVPALAEGVPVPSAFVELFGN